MADQRIIVVAGMHRSGTSAITRGLQTLGVQLGERLIPAVPNDNDKGFFEDIEVNALNMELLNALDSDWDAFPTILPSVFEQDGLEEYKARATQLIRSKVGERPLGLKDPRMARLLPFWQSVFERAKVHASYVIAIRNPMSVAQSLKRRNGFDYEKSYLLWLEHVVPAILHTRGLRRVAVSYESLISDPHAQLKRIAGALDLPFARDSREMQDYVGEFLDVRLRHAECDLSDLRADSAAPLYVVDAYEMLLRLARDEVGHDAPEVEQLFMRLQANLEILRTAFNYMTRSDRRIIERDERIARLLIERDRQIAELDGQIADRDATIHYMINSRSWKWTKPFRALRGQLRERI